MHQAFTRRTVATYLGAIHLFFPGNDTRSAFPSPSVPSNLRVKMKLPFVSNPALVSRILGLFGLGILIDR